MAGDVYADQMRAELQGSSTESINNRHEFSHYLATQGNYLQAQGDYLPARDYQIQGHYQKPQDYLRTQADYLRAQELQTQGHYLKAREDYLKTQAREDYLKAQVLHNQGHYLKPQENYFKTQDDYLKAQNLQSHEQYLKPQEDYLKTQGDYLKAQEDYLKAQDLHAQGHYLKAREDYLKAQVLHTQGNYLRAQDLQTQEYYPKAHGDYLKAQDNHLKTQALHSQVDYSKVNGDFLKAQKVDLKVPELSQGDNLKAHEDFFKAHEDILKAQDHHSLEEYPKSHRDYHKEQDKILRPQELHSQGNYHKAHEDYLKAQENDVKDQEFHSPGDFPKTHGDSNQTQEDNLKTEELLSQGDETKAQEDTDILKFLQVDMPPEEGKVGKSNKVHISDKVSEMCTYSCGYCNVVMKRCNLLYHHKTNHPGLSPKCKIVKETYHRCKLCQCDILFNNDSLAQHLKICHVGLSLKDYKEEYLRNSNDSTDKGAHPYSTSNQSNIIVTDDVNKMCVYSCNICGLTMKSNVLGHHFLNYHPNVAVQATIYRHNFHRCKICQNLVLFNPRNVSFHLRKNHKDIGYKLYKLHYLTDARSDLDENGHEEGMVRQEDFNADKHVSCELCGILLQTSEHLNCHLRGKHGILSENEYKTIQLELDKTVINGVIANVTGNNIPDENKFYTDDPKEISTVTCNTCNKEMFMTRGHLQGHFKRNHPNQAPQFSPAKSTFHKCKLCDKSLLFSPITLESHLRHHNTNWSGYKSELQKASFTDDLSLLSTAICNVCGKERAVGTMANHFKRMHPNEKIQTTAKRTTFHKCKICQTSLKFSISALTFHMRSYHSISRVSYEKQYLYNSSQLAFAEKSLTDDLSPRQRAVVASGEKEFTDDLNLVTSVACNICGRETGNKWNHFRRHHPGEKPQATPIRTTWHKCKLCGAEIKFSSQNFILHLSNSHKGFSWASYQSQFLKNPKLVAEEDQEKEMTDDLKLLSTVACNICGLEMTEKESVHFKLKHPKEKLQITPKRISWHMCKLCGKVLKFCRSTMKHHLRSAHKGCSWVNYQSQFLENPRQRKLVAEEDCSEKEVTDDLRQLSTSSCNICGLEMTEKESVHFKLKHPNQKAQTTPKRTSWHMCKLCGRVLKFCRPTMKHHLRRWHKDTTWVHYQAEYLINSRRKHESLFRCNLCGEVCNDKDEHSRQHDLVEAPTYEAVKDMELSHLVNFGLHRFGAPSIHDFKQEGEEWDAELDVKLEPGDDLEEMEPETSIKTEPEESGEPGEEKARPTLLMDDVKLDIEDNENELVDEDSDSDDEDKDRQDKGEEEAGDISEEFEPARKKAKLT